jgi:hypothetical protein
VIAHLSLRPFLALDAQARLKAYAYPATECLVSKAALIKYANHQRRLPRPGRGLYLRDMSSQLQLRHHKQHWQLPRKPVDDPLVDMETQTKSQHTSTATQEKLRLKLVRISNANCARLIYTNEVDSTVQEKGCRYRNNEDEDMCRVCKNAEAMRIKDLHHKTDWTCTVSGMAHLATRGTHQYHLRTVQHVRTSIEVDHLTRSCSRQSTSPSTRYIRRGKEERSG